MANRRQLKKTIRYIASEMLSELYLKCVFSHKKVDEAQVSQLAEDIMAQQNDFIARVSHSNGKEKAIVKSYYRTLYKEWDAAIGKTWQQISDM